ncbi:MAG: chloride channel protein [Bacteroidales bacterium]|nr:chloride channel protein [Bacteroidales bacterium]
MIRLYNKLIQFSKDSAEHITEHQMMQHEGRYFVIALSFVVGLCSGIAAVILKHAISFVKEFVVDNFASQDYNILLLISPAIGILISMLLVKYVIRDNLGHGITKILYAISKNGSSLKKHHSYASIVTSSFTIGFGGSVGAEAPIALTGACLGSNIGKFFHLDYKTITLLMACGAAGGIAGVFKAPIAGMIFTLEILMLNITLASIIPLLVSAITATSVTYFFLGRSVEFGANHAATFVLHDIPYFILFGIFTGLVALSFTRSLWFFERRIAKVKNTYTKWLIGSLFLGLLIFLFPPLYGEGYGTIETLLSGQISNIIEGSPLAMLGFSESTEMLVLILFALGVIIFKPFATATTTGAGGVGGTFAPSLFLGGVCGFFFVAALNYSGMTELSIPCFTLVGMAGVMSGVMHAPLTSIFLIAEITNGYELLVPLMIVSTVSHVTMSYFEPNSIYTKPLADKGELLTHERDKAVLTLMNLDNVIETDFVVVRSDQTLGELVKAIAKSPRNLFPVVSSRGELTGVVLLNDIRDIMFNSEMYDTTFVRDVMTIPPALIRSEETMESVMNKFESTGAWNLPVVQGHHYVGFVSKSKIFSVYRRVLTHVSYE